MARPLRIAYPGALYHLTARGNRQNKIFLDDLDHQTFLNKLEKAIKHHNWVCHAYCLMTNHYHLLIETVEPNVSNGMRDLNKDYSQAFNRRHEKIGHLLQGRFKAYIIEQEPYLLEVARYTVLNPVRARMVDHPAEWRWSSFRATAGLDESPKFLTIDWILGQFANDRANSQRAYVDFVKMGIGMKSPFEQVAHRAILGSPQFVSEMWKRSNESMFIKDIPREERIIGRLTLEELFSFEQSKEQRNEMIVFARVGCSYSVAEIARFLKMSQAQVSEISRKNPKPKTEDLTP